MNIYQFTDCIYKELEAQCFLLQRSSSLRLFKISRGGCYIFKQLLSTFHEQLLANIVVFTCILGHYLSHKKMVRQIFIMFLFTKRLMICVIGFFNTEILLKYMCNKTQYRLE